MSPSMKREGTAMCDREGGGGAREGEREGEGRGRGEWSPIEQRRSKEVEEQRHPPPSQLLVVGMKRSHGQLG